VVLYYLFGRGTVKIIVIYNATFPLITKKLNRHKNCGSGRTVWPKRTMIAYAGLGRTNDAVRESSASAQPGPLARIHARIGRGGLHPRWPDVEAYRFGRWRSEAGPGMETAAR